MTGSSVRSAQRVTIGAAAAALLLSAGGLIGAHFVKSPQQLAVEAAGPQPSVVTAPVERRVLRHTVVLRGQAGALGSYDVTPAVQGGARAVVTGVRVKVGAEVGAGTVLLEVAGRPLVTLAGSLPAYRDLRPGSTGADVAQLQAALRAGGQHVADAKGVFGPGTRQALTRFYAKFGYEPFLTPEPSRQQVDSAGLKVQEARWAVADAQAALDRLRGAPPTPKPGEPDPVQEAARLLARAQETLALALREAQDLEARYGAMLPLAEYVFLPAFPARVDKLTAVVGAEVQSPLVTLSSGALVVHANLNPSQRALLKPQLKVEITSELTGGSYQGRIDSIGELAQDSSGGRSFPMTVVADGTPLDRKLGGEDLRLTVEAASTDGPVLVIPLSAVYSGVDGRTSVLKKLPDGRQERVFVRPGASGDGFVAIEVVGGDLQPGDEVVVGY